MLIVCADIFSYRILFKLQQILNNKVRKHGRGLHKLFFFFIASVSGYKGGCYFTIDEQRQCVCSYITILCLICKILNSLDTTYSCHIIYIQEIYILVYLSASNNRNYNFRTLLSLHVFFNLGFFLICFYAAFPSY